MTEPIDPVTSVLTGHVSFYLLLAAFLTWPTAYAFLWLYARAVRRSMRSRAHAAQPAGEAHAYAPRDGPDTEADGGTAATLHDLGDGAAVSDSANVLLTQLVSRPWRAAAVYVVAGIAYGAVMAVAQLLASGLEILPIRTLFLAWTFAWPAVLTVGIVAADTRRSKAVLTASYFAGLTIIGAIEMPRSPDLTWPQVFGPWVLYDLPPTILMLTYLSRRVRAVGPLILTFIVLGLIGSDVVLNAAGSSNAVLLRIIKITSPLGLGGSGTFYLLIGLGFALFGVVGWMALRWIRARYVAKQISDQSLTIDAIWMLFTIIFSMDLSFGHPLWTLAGVVSFAAYKMCVRIGFAQLMRRDPVPQKGPALLVLRSFSIGHDSEHLFDVVGRHWRRVGSMQMIAGVDLVSRTVEPHEFLDFVSGKLARRFIDSEEVLNRRISERDVAPDRDLRFRINEFFCYDDTWKLTFARLVHDSDAVLMDLRGFSRQNAGCVFELHELARMVALDRVVFVVDGRTDAVLLAQTLGNGNVGVFRLGALTATHIRQLLRAMARAAVSATSAARV
jgi:hypothetical protein